VLRFQRIDYQGARPAGGAGRYRSPERFDLRAVRESDTLRLRVKVEDALATDMSADGFRRGFLQMRGHFTLSGRVLGKMVTDSGSGFFETYVSRSHD
jgi:hypothetical protein